MSDQPQQLGKYMLTRHLATGGMAEIWLAEQEGPGGFNKELVIKRILPNFADDAKFTTMFLDEARLAAQLSHPKIAQIYELGEIDDQYFIAMEYIQGIDLDVLLSMAMDKGTPVPIDIVCKVVMDVLEALDYAHDFTGRDGQPFNLVHRDVSPHNVLVSNDGIVKLCDFGVAKAKANQTKTQPGAVKGKFAYMAPEQIQNAADLDRRADVFAAGILLFELLSGEKPFGDELAAVNNIIARPHPDVRTKRADVPDELAAVIDQALQKDRTHRYPNAHAMLRDIETYVRGSGAYVGDRELSRYVRTMQGLPITRHSQPAVAVDDTEPPHELERRIDPLGDTGEQDLASPEQLAEARGERITNREDPVEDTGTAQVPSVNTSGERTNTISAEVEVDDDDGGGNNFLLFAVFGALIIAILGAVGYIVLVVLPPPERPNVQTKQEPIKQPTANKGNKSLLSHSGGLPVYISSTPSAEIYVDGQLVSTTPFDTNLRPGTYKVELRTTDARKSEKIEVKPDQPLQRFKFKL